MTVTTTPDVDVHPTPLRRALRSWAQFGAPPRIAGVDLARALAIVGMMGAHLGAASVVGVGDVIWTEPETWIAVVHGRSAILFALLAGVSLALLTGGTTPPTGDGLAKARLGLVGRGLIVLGIGVVLELMGTAVLVILSVWGIVFILAVTFIQWRVKTLLITAGALAVAGPPAAALLEFVNLGFSGAGSSLVQGFYPLSVWLVFVFTGLALGRLGLTRTRVAVWSLVTGVALAVAGYSLGALARAGAFGASIKEAFDQGFSTSSLGSESVSSLPLGSSSLPSGSGSVAPSIVDGAGNYFQSLADGTPLSTVLALTLDSSPHSGGIAEILGSGGFALAVLGLCLLVANRVQVLIVPLLALGSMPLTAYSSHVVVFLILAGGPGGFLDPDPIVWPLTVALTTLACTIWALTVGRGPLESLTARAARALQGGRARQTTG